MKKFLLIAIIGCLWAGGSELWNSIRYRNPALVAMSDQAAPDLPAYFTLQNVSVDAVDALYYREIGLPKAYLPVRLRGAKDDSSIHVLLTSEDPGVLKLKGDAGQNKLTAELLKSALDTYKQWSGKTEITGRPDRHTIKDKERQAMIKAQPLLSPDFVIISEGDGPSLAVGLLVLGFGAALIALLVYLGGNGKPAAAGVSVTQPEPPKL